MKYCNIREEELKNRIAEDYFWLFDCNSIIGNVDFCVRIHSSDSTIFEGSPLLWAEAKKDSSDINKSLVQLIITIGKARTFDNFMPPPFLGAFDGEKIAFIPYNDIHEIFYQNDFNWNITPSNYETKEFQLVYDKVKSSLESKSLLYYYEKDEKDLKNFIKLNFLEGKYGLTKIKVDKNNFMVVYTKWLNTVKSTIAINWDEAKKAGIIDGDFYLADLLSVENISLKEKLFVFLKESKYELNKFKNQYGGITFDTIFYKDNQLAHTQFWNKYERPPKEEYWEFMSDRRDLLVPQDVRERKGSFFTPQIWVELSQQYLANELGQDWQEDYYIWDCAAGTGNLLNGLVNKYNIFASTLDKQDVAVMLDRIETMNNNSPQNDGASLLKDHVFQFDFLNDSFDKLPINLQNIINDPIKRKKLVIYINPPYAEASDKKTFNKKEGKRGVEQSLINKKYASKLGQGNAELFVQFLTRIYIEIPDCIIAEFSTLKIISGPHFKDFRTFFHSKFLSGFVCPANSFDNVKGSFPIGFMIWDTFVKIPILEIKPNVYDLNGNQLEPKMFYSYYNDQYINDWIKPYRADASKNQLIGKFPFKGNDFQNQNIIQIVHHKMDYNTEAGQFLINQKNVIFACIYFAVRKCIKANWLNDRDQFLFPNEDWKNDSYFQSDCLTFTLFTNNIQSKYGVNHWIPFSEKDVNAKTKFESNFMKNYILGKVDTEISFDLFNKVEKDEQKPINFSKVALDVFAAGKNLWNYYHSHSDCNVNAALYDIQEYFQGRNELGKMKNKSEDNTYTTLIHTLRGHLKQLAIQIEPKVYKYGFLK